MANKVGPKGQVVIEKEIRDRLGVQPGWQALQMLVDGYVRIDFIPPPHNRSLRGALAKYVTRSIATEDEFHEATERAWEEAVKEEWAAESPSDE